MSRDTERLIDDVGSTLLSRMVVDQESYKIETESLDMLLNRRSKSSLQNNRDSIEEDVGFRLSLAAVTDVKAKDAKFVDSVVSSLRDC